MTERARASGNGASADPTGRLVARAGRATETRAHELESGLSWHLARLRAASDDARRELEAGAAERRTRLNRTLAVPSVSSRQVHRVFDRLRTQGRRSRVAVAGALAVAVVTATGAFVATQAVPGDQRAQRPTSTSDARSSRSPSRTTARSTDAAAAAGTTPATEAPAPSALPGPSIPAAPGTSNATRAPAPGTGAAPAGTPPAPGSTSAPPSNTSPPNSPPPTRSPTCQLLPVVCP